MTPESLENIRWWWSIPEPLLVIGAGLMLFYAVALRGTWTHCRYRRYRDQSIRARRDSLDPCG